MADAYKVNKHIQNLVEAYAKQGLSLNQAWVEAQKRGYQNLPRSSGTFYKHYRIFHEAALAEVVGKVGSKVIDQALEGDFNSQQLFLRSKGGWNQKDIVETREVEDDEDEKQSALDALIDSLGIKD